MKKNEHGADRILRIVFGIAILATVFIGPKTMWGLLGLIPLITGLVGFCPVYKLLGVGTATAS